MRGGAISFAYAICGLERFMDPTYVLYLYWQSVFPVDVLVDKRCELSQKSLIETVSGKLIGLCAEIEVNIKSHQLKIKFDHLSKEINIYY